MDEEEWEVLHGCNSCINTAVCEKLGNCILLSINHAMPENDKKKKRLISKVRTFGNGGMEQLNAYKSQLEKQAGKKEVAVIDTPTVRLTLLEKMFLESLNKKR